MKKLFKLSAIILALMMFITSLASCDTNSGASEPTSYTATTTSPATATVPLNPGQGMNTETKNEFKLLIDGKEAPTYELFMYSDIWSEEENKLVHTQNELYDFLGDITNHSQALDYAVSITSATTTSPSTDKYQSIPSSKIDYNEEYLNKNPSISVDMSSNGTLTKVQFFNSLDVSHPRYSYALENSEQSDIFQDIQKNFDELYYTYWVTVFTVVWQGDYIAELGKYDETTYNYLLFLIKQPRDYTKELSKLLGGFSFSKINLVVYDSGGRLKYPTIVIFEGKTFTKTFYSVNEDYAKLRIISGTRKTYIYDSTQKSPFINRISKELYDALAIIIENGYTDPNG